MADKKQMIPTSLAPWFDIDNAPQAVTFYKDAFGATETYRLEMDGGLVVQLSVDGAAFWVSGNTGDSGKTADVHQKMRMILTVSDPDACFEKALRAGAKELSPVNNAHGWRTGRFLDPFGFQWEIGRPL